MTHQFNHFAIQVSDISTTAERYRAFYGHTWHPSVHSATRGGNDLLGHLLAGRYSICSSRRRHFSIPLSNNVFNLYPNVFFRATHYLDMVGVYDPALSRSSPKIDCCFY